MRTIILAALLFLVMSPGQSSALSCVTDRPIEESYANYDAILTGKVEKITPDAQNNNIVKIAVTKSFKGYSEESITVSENMTWGATWGPSEVGEEYLFFLKTKEKSGWENPLCAPSAKIADSAKALEYLEPKKLTLDHSTTAPTELPRSEEIAAKSAHVPNESNKGLNASESIEWVHPKPPAIVSWFAAASILMFTAAIIAGILYFRKYKRS